MTVFSAWPSAAKRHEFLHKRHQFLRFVATHGDLHQQMKLTGGTA